MGLPRQKGAAFERWVAEQFRAAGLSGARRGLGRARSASEVPDLDWTVWWVEAKHRKRVNIRVTLEQAESAWGHQDDLPVLVVSRANVLATMRLYDLLALYRGCEARIAAMQAGPRETLAGKKDL